MRNREAVMHEADAAALMLITEARLRGLKWRQIAAGTGSPNAIAARVRARRLAVKARALMLRDFGAARDEGEPGG